MLRYTGSQKMKMHVCDCILELAFLVGKLPKGVFLRSQDQSTVTESEVLGLKF